MKPRDFDNLEAAFNETHKDLSTSSLNKLHPSCRGGIRRREPKAVAVAGIS